MKLFLLLLILLSENSCAEIYKCNNHYSEKPCGDNAEIIKVEKGPPIEPSETYSSSSSTNNNSIFGKVVRVTDCDTITIQTENRKEKIRLAEIDAPEVSHFGSKAQPYGKESGEYLRNLVAHKNVRVDIETVDKYGRIVGIVYVDGKNINLEMVKNGLAWVYRFYAHDANLIELEKDARAQRLGLWSLDNPIYPPDFRKANK